LQCAQSLQCDVVDGQLTFNAHIDSAALLFELPERHAAFRCKTHIDALMRSKIMRGNKFRPIGKIRRRSDDGHAQIRADAHCDHILRDRLAHPHACIESFSNDVDEAEIDADFNVEVRILLK
jgi:hypothetical protein